LSRGGYKDSKGSSPHPLHPSHGGEYEENERNAERYALRWEFLGRMFLRGKFGGKRIFFRGGKFGGKRDFFRGGSLVKKREIFLHFLFTN
jgi:hypothetical protein